ncbi:hypothetical protein AGMMS4956_20160 [Bacteroidia bacterium]|nr:hypothetical protein AGMMS4956_20160 [Bacteroidia bacterium]
MEYNDFFIPVAEHLQKLQPPLLPAQVGNAAKFAVPGFDWEWLQGFQIALVGLRPAGSPNSFAAVREALYRLYVPAKKVSIIDLGDIEVANNSVEANTEKVGYALQQILLQGTFPLVLAEDMRYAHWVYEALKSLHRSQSVAYILPTANIGNPHTPITEQNVIAHTLADLTRELAHLSVLGYQNYLTNPDDVRTLDKNYCETVRLGALRDNLQQAEPVLRDATLLCAAVSALRQSDAPAAMPAMPNGFYTEEMCRMLRFASFSSELKAFFMGGMNLSNDRQQQTANLLAQLVWHVIEGIAYRIQEHPAENKKKFRRVQVEMGTREQRLIFYQSKVSHRWWMEIPTNDSAVKHIIACQATDYEQARQMELPDRWLWFFKKFSR